MKCRRENVCQFRGDFFFRWFGSRYSTSILNIVDVYIRYSWLYKHIQFVSDREENIVSDLWQRHDDDYMQRIIFMPSIMYIESVKLSFDIQRTAIDARWMKEREMKVVRARVRCWIDFSFSRCCSRCRVFVDFISNFKALRWIGVQ